MKTKLLARAAALSLLSMSFAMPASAQKYAAVKNSAKSSVKMAVRNEAPKTAEGNLIKVPTHQITYKMIDGVWKKDSESRAFYNDKGLKNTFILTDFDVDGKIILSQKETNTYYENGMRSKSNIYLRYSEDEEWTDSQRYEYTYDEICPDVVVEQIAEKFENGQWVPNMMFSRYTDIVRDEQNRVTLAQMYYNRNKEEYMIGFAYSYDGSENASLVKQFLPKDNVPCLRVLLKNIEWIKSNNQNTILKGGTYFAFNYDPENIVGSYVADIYDEQGEITEEGTMVRNFYDSKGRQTSIQIFFDNGTCAANINKYDLDQNGSRSFMFTYFRDYNHNKQYDEGEETTTYETSYQYYTYDEHGQMTCEETYGYNYDTGNIDDLCSKITYEYRYNDDNTVAERITTNYERDGSVLYKTKVVNTEFAEIVQTGISSISDKEMPVRVTRDYISAPDIAGKPYVISDMAGRTYDSGITTNNRIDISKLNRGAYIIKVGNRAFKAVKR